MKFNTQRGIVCINGLTVWNSAIWRLKTSGVTVQIAIRLHPTVIKTETQWVLKTCVLRHDVPRLHTSSLAHQPKQLFFKKTLCLLLSSLIPNLGPNTKLRAMYSNYFRSGLFQCHSCRSVTQLFHVLHVILLPSPCTTSLWTKYIVRSLE